MNAAAVQPIVILISGRGSNMHALIDAAAAPQAPFRVAAVLSDKPSAAGLTTAGDAGIAARAVPAAGFADREVYDRLMADAIDAYAPALVVLAGFMRILSKAFVDKYAGRLMNIHPSLLPKYPGLHTHRQALAAGDTHHGATVHFVTEELDGGPAILQAKVAIETGDDEASLAARVVQQEHRIYPLAVRWFCEGRLVCRDDRAWLDAKALLAPVQYAA